MRWAMVAVLMEEKPSMSDGSMARRAGSDGGVDGQGGEAGAGILIRKGSFMMEARRRNPARGTDEVQHQVTLTTDFGWQESRK